MKVCVGILFLVLSQASMAGGDFSPGQITEFISDGEVTSFKFTQTKNEQQLIQSCPSFTVKLHYERVPWFSWLPFIKTNHPTKEQTENAVSYIKNAFKENKEIYFGYMGSGLIYTDVPCVFLSRGLLLSGDEDSLYVLSFYNPV